MIYAHAPEKTVLRLDLTQDNRVCYHFPEIFISILILDQTGNWILIGIIGGLCLLTLTALCCCFYHCKLWLVFKNILFALLTQIFSLFADRDLVRNREEFIIELYHIERCVDFNCAFNKSPEKVSSVWIRGINRSEYNVIEQNIKKHPKLSKTIPQAIPYNAFDGVDLRPNSDPVISPKNNFVYMSYRSGIYPSMRGASFSNVEIHRMKPKRK